jgi:L-ascorbate metabolism protein UlaG (beta-lactamase superfamily)/uncharacterized protein YbbK (DUF523 family)
MANPPVIVSACLVGIDTRHDGTNSVSEEVLSIIRGRPFIPVCPEQLGGLPTPRPRAEINDGEGLDVLEGRAMVINENGGNVTQAFVKGAIEAIKIASLIGSDEAVLKEKSPSCGVNLICRGNGCMKGRGVFTALLMRRGLKTIKGVLGKGGCMKLAYHGHSCFLIEGDSGSIIIDPFLNGNPVAVIKAAQVKVDAVLVSHGHGDHLGDAIEISKRNNAPVIGTFELVNYCAGKGATGHAMHIGGGHAFPFGKVKLTIAHHGSGADAGELGNPCGFLITMDGKTVYHAGDTGLFSDMALIGKTSPIDCALLPIGDNFTMGIEDAITAVQMLSPKSVVPMHYNTWELIRQDPLLFKKGLEGKPVSVQVMKPGEAINI